ncbi:unnamed protein product [Prunus brigantina]
MKQYFPLALVSMLWLSHMRKALIGLNLPSCLRNNWKMEFDCINCSNSSRSFIICGNLLQRSSVTVILKFLGLGSCDLDINYKQLSHILPGAFTFLFPYYSQKICTFIIKPRIICKCGKKKICSKKRILKYAQQKCFSKAEYKKQNLFRYVRVSVYIKIVEKADITFGKMKELGLAKGFSDYNEMPLESGDFDQMEKVLVKMEADPLVTMDWRGYFVAAKACLKAGLLERTSTFLRRSEQLIDNESRKIGYERLMTSYAAIGNKDEVYRIWDLHKNTVGFYNNGYRCMVSSLVKLGDIDGAEKIVQEWESGVKSYDIRIPNLLVTAYRRQGLFEKAK